MCELPPSFLQGLFVFQGDFRDNADNYLIISQDIGRITLQRLIILDSHKCTSGRYRGLLEHKQQNLS